MLPKLAYLKKGVFTIEFRYVSWGEVEALCISVAEQVRASGYAPDGIVTLGRGGWVPARLISDCLGVRDVVSLGMKYYAGIGKTLDAPLITQPLPAGSIRGKNVLLVDDLADTGASIARARLELRDAAAVRVATVHFKPRANPRPDYSGEETTDWVVYPWERRETERDLRVHAAGAGGINGPGTARKAF